MYSFLGLTPVFARGALPGCTLSLVLPRVGRTDQTGNPGPGPCSCRRSSVTSGTRYLGQFAYLCHTRGRFACKGPAQALRITFTTGGWFAALRMRLPPPPLATPGLQVGRQECYSGGCLALRSRSPAPAGWATAYAGTVLSDSACRGVRGFLHVASLFHAE